VTDGIAAITAFIEQRLAEREAKAKAATPGGWYSFCSGHGDDWYVASRGYGQVSTGLHSDPDGDEILMIERDRRDAEFIAANDPASVLRDVAAKREILTELAAQASVMGGSGAYRHCYEMVAREFAAIWDGHPGYQARWKPWKP
jgi:hypothetical protein